MSALVTPTSVSELIEAVRSTPQLIPVGALTKPRLSAVSVTRLATARLRGVVEYEPGEFTVTAQAGLPVRELASLLEQHGQYLPFDPMLMEAGATLGGTVASGLSGPGRFRFGSLRDFILGIRFVDGGGRLLRMGGKVVKNAAGFDLPKFFVGSLGRFGVLTEMTFKVFPRPAATLTLKLHADGMEARACILIDAANERWELDALELVPDDGAVCLRLAGPQAALPILAREILARWPGEILNADEAGALWIRLREFRWADPGGALIRVALNPEQVAQVTALVRACEGGRVHISGGGNVAFISLPATVETAFVDESLRTLGLSAVTLRGVAPLWLGVRRRPRIAQDVKGALDAENRFPGLDD